MGIKYFVAKIIKKIRGSAIRDSAIHIDAKIESGSVIVRSALGRHSFCGYDCVVVDAQIGPFVSIGTRVTIGGATHPMHFVSTSPAFLSHKDSVPKKLARHHYLPIFTTHIGADVWIGDGAFIKAGVRIGPGAVVGMGAVVTRDVEPYAVVAGNPAKVIRKRFPLDLCNELFDSKWWEKADDQLTLLGSFSDRPAEFLAALRRLDAQ